MGCLVRYCKRRNIWLIRPTSSLPLCLLLSAFLTLPLVSTGQAPGWWCLERGVNSERTSPLLRTHAQQKWSEDAFSLSTNSPARQPFTSPAAAAPPSPNRAFNCPLPWFTRGTCAAGARPARRRRQEQASETRSTVSSIAYPWRATRRYGHADKRTLPRSEGAPAAYLLHSIGYFQR